LVASLYESAQFMACLVPKAMGRTQKYAANLDECVGRKYNEAYFSVSLLLCERNKSGGKTTLLQFFGPKYIFLDLLTSPISNGFQCNFFLHMVQAPLKKLEELLHTI